MRAEVHTPEMFTEIYSQWRAGLCLRKGLWVAAGLIVTPAAVSLWETDGYGESWVQERTKACPRILALFFSKNKLKKRPARGSEDSRLELNSQLVD